MARRRCCSHPQAAEDMRSLLSPPSLPAAGHVRRFLFHPPEHESVDVHTAVLDRDPCRWRFAYAFDGLSDRDATTEHPDGPLSLSAI